MTKKAFLPLLLALGVGAFGQSSPGLPASGGATAASSTWTRYPQAHFVSGRVTVEEGTGIPWPAAIQTVCNGHGRTVGYTDRNGNFTVQLDGDKQFSGPDASSPSGSDPGNSFSIAQTCELQAELAGFVSDKVNLAASASDALVG